MPDLQLGHRVFHSSDGRPGFVIGKPEMAGWNRALVPVVVEGTTRTELWPLSRLVVRPDIDQCKKLGGEYKPPAGYPLNS